MKPEEYMKISRMTYEELYTRAEILSSRIEVLREARDMIREVLSQIEKENPDA